MGFLNWIGQVKNFMNITIFWGRKQVDISPREQIKAWCFSLHIWKNLPQTNNAGQIDGSHLLKE